MDDGRRPVALLVGLGTVLLLDSLIRVIPSTDFSARYGGTTIAIVAVMLTLVGYGFFTSLAGRPLFRDGLVPED